MRRFHAILLTAALVCVFFPAVVNAHSVRDPDGWTPVKKDVYIRENSITYPSDATVSLWIKVIPETGTDLLVEARTQLMNKGRDDQALAYDYTGYLSEIDCANHKHRELIAILYDVNKNIVHSVQHGRPSWDVIASGSSFEAVHKAVCGYD
jgi:hypothetical protein